jgi:WD40 repeat protein
MLLGIVFLAVCTALVAIVWKVVWVGQPIASNVALAPARLTLDANGEDVACVAFSPDGKLVAAGTWNGSLLVWNAADGRPIACFSTQSVMALAFSPDSERIVTASSGVQLWDIATQREIGRIFDNVHARCVAFSPDGTKIAIGTGSPEGDVWLWEAKTARARCVFRYANSDVGKSTSGIGVCHSIAFSEKGDTLVAAARTGIAVLDLANGIEKFLAGDETQIVSVGYLRDGETVVGVAGGAKAFLWNGATAQKLRTLEDRSYRGAFGPVSIASRNGLLAVSSGRGIAVPHRVLFFRSEQRFPIAEFTGHEDVIEGLAFSPDGRMLVTGSKRGSVKIWNVDDFVDPRNEVGESGR